MAASAGDMAQRLKSLSGEMGGAAQKARLRRVGMASKGDINAAVERTLGDDSMSGWRRGSPIPIRGEFTVKTDSVLEMAPSGRSRGPMRVLQSGRNQGNSGGMAGPGISADGTTRRTKSGAVRKVRARQSRHWNGRTRGKGTWTYATEIMTREMPERYWQDLAEPVAKHVTGRG